MMRVLSAVKKRKTNYFSIVLQCGVSAGANMIIRVDKCSTFVIRKESTKSVQYLLKLFLNTSLVLRIEIGKSFPYLGRYFDFKMSDEDHKSEVYDTLTNIVKQIDDLRTIASEKQTLGTSLFQI